MTGQVIRDRLAAPLVLVLVALSDLGLIVAVILYVFRNLSGGAPTPY